MRTVCASVIVSGVLASAVVLAQSTPVVVDLMTPEGVGLVKGQWRYSDARIIEAPAGRSGIQGLAYMIEPQAGPADFDDSGWPAIAPGELSVRRTGGRVSFNWYRIRLTMPERVGDFQTAGSKAFFSVVIDDYAEVWVNGTLPRNPGGLSPNLISGFNVPNRVPLTESVKPGETILVAVFGLNGPISEGPGNRIFVRKATLEFER
jgi:gluconolactonase